MTVNNSIQMTVFLSCRDFVLHWPKLCNFKGSNITLNKSDEINNKKEFSIVLKKQGFLELINWQPVPFEISS